ncbi:ABC transporter permease, partial [Bacillus subtilis]|nr:ABC transporter permease [Bacillus subtilis]
AVGAVLLMAWLERALSPVNKKRTGAKHVQSAA